MSDYQDVADALAKIAPGQLSMIRRDIVALMEMANEKGCADLSAATARIAKLETERDALREALTKHDVKCANGDVLSVADALETAAGTLMCFIDADEEAGSNGLRDCTDNDGCAYQSEFMAGLIDHARASAADLSKWATAFRAAPFSAKR